MINPSLTQKTVGDASADPRVAIFLAVATKGHETLHLPVSPEAAWPKLDEALEALVANIQTKAAQRKAKKETALGQGENDRTGE